MKRAGYLLMAALAVSAISATLVSGAGQAFGGEKFGFTCMTMNNPFFTTIEASVRKEVTAAGNTLITLDTKQDIATQISEEMTFPGQIKVTVIRSFEAVATAN